MTIDSKTRHGPGELADAVGTAARATLGMVRRMAIKVTSKAIWQVAGHLLLDKTRETRDAEVFYGIGFWARPKSSEKAEALVFFQSAGAGSPVVVATRNEDARRAVEAVIGTLKEGEAIMFGSSGLPFLHIRDNLTAEIRKAGGTAVELATKADVQTIRNELHQHTHNFGSLTCTGGTIAGATAAGPSVTTPAGTTVLKAQ